MRKKISRRQFVKTGVGLGLAAAGLSCVTPGSRGVASVGASDEFDYIVVGSGAGGGPVAANLAKNGFRVLLLEAGDNTKGRNYDVPSFHPLATDDPKMRWDFFVNHYTDPARQAQDSKYVPGKGVLYPRAGTLGGCTAHNAMLTLYPDNQDWDDIAALFPDDPSWRSSVMRQYYQRIERVGYSVSPGDRRGYAGWLDVEKPNLGVRLKDWDWKMHEIAIAAAGGKTPLDVLALRQIHDPNDWSVVNNRKDGAYTIPKATRRGHRNGSRELILAAIAQYPGNLELRTNALATRVLFEGPDQRAVGLEYLEGAHVYRADPNSNAASAASAVPRTVRARREVILSGGAFNSPQLLMLSGIGPRAELQRHGIEVRVDLPGVGQNLQDRYEIGVVTKLKSEFEAIAACTFGASGDPCLLGYDVDASHSIYSSNGPIVTLLQRSNANRANPDLALFALPGRFRGYYPGWARECMQKDYLTWAILKGHTRNTAGSVKLRSSNPLDTPEINFNYFDEGTGGGDEDLQAILKGIEIARGKNQHPMISKLIDREELPLAQGDDLKQFVKKEAWGHHASCTNKMGPDSDPMAVLDGKFRVRGTKGLRVVDASVFPKIPGLFIVVPIYMIAEKASDDIIAAAKG